MKCNQLFENEYHYVGDCKNSFRENGVCKFYNFVDVTDFAQAEERAIRISKLAFQLFVVIPEEITKAIHSHKIEYMYSKLKNVYMLYDIDDDTHYFFTK